jgi:polynucleotide 5'-kinase involved in rRNA processing
VGTSCLATFPHSGQKHNQNEQQSGEMVRTIEQQVAETQAKLARLKTRAKAQDTRRKIIVGAIVTTEALKDPKIAKWLASTLRKNATREVDQKELAGLLVDLDAKAQSAGAGEA